jgi:hypothetical protein
MYPAALPGYIPGYGMYPSANPAAALNPYMYPNPLQNVVYGYNPYELEMAQAMMANQTPVMYT